HRLGLESTLVLASFKSHLNSFPKSARLPTIKERIEFGFSRVSPNSRDCKRSNWPISYVFLVSLLHRCYMAVDGSNKPPFNDDEPGSGVGVVTEHQVSTQRPSLYKVLLHNDDYTPMDFVVDVLERFFNKTHAQATEIMLAIHHKGMGLCGIFPYEV